MKIGIFGGTFNPPHKGHVQAAINAAAAYDIDLLMVIPAGNPPHKVVPDGTPAPFMRLEMTKNAFPCSGRLLVSDLEIYSQEINYTIDTVKSIKREYPDAVLFLLVGNDMYDALDTWKDSKSLLKFVTPVLLPREIINISSSEIRKLLPLRKGKEFLTDSNYSYIIKHRLYGSKPDWEWLREQAHKMLAPARIPHVNACEIEAVRLAECWNEDPDDAREAAILHDITKKLDFSQNMCIIAEHGANTDVPGSDEEKLLHSITGALLAQSLFGVSDKVANAIKWHTTGRAQMTMLEKIIYVADYIESTRNFTGVDDLRIMAYKNIDEAMISGLEMTVGDLQSRGIAPNIATLEALKTLNMLH